jgi:hypothetical protein
VNLDKKQISSNLTQLSGSILKRREKKYNQKISSGIYQMRRSYRQMHFFNQLHANPKVHL